jgi:hypothetical protein
MKLKSIALAAILALGSTVAMSAPKGDDWVPPGQRGTGGAGEQGQQQQQGQQQGQQANAGAVGVGVGVGGSSQQAQGQSSENTNINNFVVPEGGLVGPSTQTFNVPEGAVQGGDAKAASGAYSGSDSTSSVGDTLSQSKSASGAISGGNDTAQDVNVDASDQSVTDISYNTDYPVSTAAALFTQVCQQGVSGQSDDWGASAVFSDPLCDEIKVAQFYWIAHINEHKHGNDEQAAEFKEKYVAQMESIETMMDVTGELGILDRIAGFLLKPMAVIGLLVFLL